MVKQKNKKILLVSLWLNVLAITGIFILRPRLNEAVDFIFTFGLIGMAIFTLYGIMKEPRSRAILYASITLNIYALILLVVVGAGLLGLIPDSFEINYLIILLSLGIPLIGFAVLGMTIQNYSHTKK